jgi:putative GTP pyrophosphokinase
MYIKYEEIIVKDLPQESEFDFESHGQNALNEYIEVRQRYESFAKVIHSILQEALNYKSIRVHSIEARAKEANSFFKKTIKPSESDPNKPKYQNPLREITDLAGARVITFFLRTIEVVEKIISDEFQVLEIIDKTNILQEQERFGYQSIHYIVRLRENRTSLPEYSAFTGLVGEIQVRTILQHSWAEIEHDIQYKSVATIPSSIKRRFMSLAGLLEIADREFQAIQKEDERIRIEARKSVEAGRLEDVEITPDALKVYLDKRLGSDGRMSEFSYELLARDLRHMGFTTFQQLDECARPYDGDYLSRIFYGNRQGQITRFEMELLASMGENYIQRHPWANELWFPGSCRSKLDRFIQDGITIGCYCPDNKNIQNTPVGET